MSDKPSPANPSKAGAKPRATTVKKTPAKKAASSEAAGEKPAVKKAAARRTTAKKTAPAQRPAKRPRSADAGAGSDNKDKQAQPPPMQKPAPEVPNQAPAAQKRAQATQAPRSTQNDARTAAGADLIRVPMAVRWRDLDAFNHVNNSKYLSYLEEARLHWMMGVPGQGMDDHVAPVVAAAQLNYRRPITWPAEVVVELFVERLGSTSLSIGHRIVDDEDRSIVYCDGNVVMVWIDRDSGRAAELPRKVREACSPSG